MWWFGGAKNPHHLGALDVRGSRAFFAPPNLRDRLPDSRCRDTRGPLPQPDSVCPAPGLFKGAPTSRRLRRWPAATLEQPAAPARKAFGGRGRGTVEEEQAAGITNGREAANTQPERVRQTSAHGSPLCQGVAAGAGLALLVAGPGSGFSEGSVCGVRPVALDCRVVPECPPGLAFSCCRWSASMRA